MSYTTPTAIELKAAFPAFACVADDTVDFWITRAERSVDDSWTEGDRGFAVMLLACHLMTEQGLGTGAEAEAAAAGASGFKRMKSGALELDRFDANNGTVADAYSGTAYGRQFALLLRQNKGGPRISATGTDAPYPPTWSYVDGGA